MRQKRIAIFASGSGTNAQNIMEYFADNKSVVVDSLWANKADAFALVRAQNFGIETFIFNRDEFNNSTYIGATLNQRKVDLIVLAGFLWLIPYYLIRSFTIINIHPALLPKYGGKGMYGMNIHKSVVQNGDAESGITIHYVNEKYDEGTIIFQAKCPVLAGDTPEQVATKVHELEYKHFPEVIESILEKL